ncbi:hypothetical protein BS47DRAFT_1361731 [Hydnum rufescens UP504]|uniref:Uncharacterized protein n=1 Tax=Hydnum rufescens UP504 TaxID=1448309 RepID=A0A9P6AYR9_9AGAM|nr:hypothetical protein BS47DRAFT_1361731 [Hydnum rufescens UP504]
MASSAGDLEPLKGFHRQNLVLDPHGDDAMLQRAPQHPQQGGCKHGLWKKVTSAQFEIWISHLLTHLVLGKHLELDVGLHFVSLLSVYEVWALPDNETEAISSYHILERYLYPVAQTLQGGKSIENQGLQFFHIQRVILHTPGDQVPTFLRDWIHLPAPVPSIPSTSNKCQRSPTPLEAPSKQLKDDSLSVDAMDIDDSSNTKDGSAMDVNDPQSDPLQSLLPLVPPRSSISVMRNQTPAPTTLTSTMHQIMPWNPQALCVITATHWIGI